MSTNIQSLVSEFASQIEAVVQQSVEERVREVLDGAFGGAGKRGRKAGVAGRVSKPASAKVQRSRKLQGQYLGALKSLKGAERARVKATAKNDGVAAAVALAKKLKN